ncbi:hypothetical protein ACROYT_G039456 [Oculina patagonica]
MTSSEIPGRFSSTVTVVHRVRAAVAKKFFFIFSLVLYTNSLGTGQQNDCASSCNPITIGVHGNVDMKM